MKRTTRDLHRTTTDVQGHVRGPIIHTRVFFICCTTSATTTSMVPPFSSQHIVLLLILKHAGVPCFVVVVVVTLLYFVVILLILHFVVGKGSVPVILCYFNTFFLMLLPIYKF